MISEYLYIYIFESLTAQGIKFRQRAREDFLLLPFFLLFISFTLFFYFTFLQWYLFLVEDVSLNFLFFFLYTLMFETCWKTRLVVRRHMKGSKDLLSIFFS